MKFPLENDGVAIQPPRCHIEGMTEKKPKRPRDPNQLAKLIVDIATGEEEDRKPSKDQDQIAAAKRKGAKARARSLTPQERSEIASAAAAARWKKG